MRTELRHLLLLTLEDPHNPESWSGTPYAIREALEAQVERVSIRGSMKVKRTLINSVLRTVLGGTPPRYPLWMTDAALKSFAADTQRALDELKPDAIFCISSQRILYLNDPGIPMFMFSDAPWISWKETYKDYERTPWLAKKFAALEASVARRCDGLIYASEWARQEAIRLFGVSPEKVHSHPLGAASLPPLTEQEVEAEIGARPDDRLDLLFVGKDWERKGGPMAVEIARGLHAKGVDVTLHIVGNQPTLAPSDEVFVKRYGFLSTRDPEQASRLHELYLKSHFLVVPTQAECYGLVFAEAHAFGLPAVSCAVQAVPSIIADGETGIVQPKGDAAEAYIARLQPLIADRVAYRRMAHAARTRYVNLLELGALCQGLPRRYRGLSPKKEPTRGDRFHKKRQADCSCWCSRSR